MSEGYSQPDDDELGRQLDRTVDNQNVSYYEARRRLGIEQPDRTAPAPRSPRMLPPAAVNLAKRATALAAIMDAFNQANRAQGGRRALENKDPSFTRHFEDPEQVATMMSKKGRQAIDALAGDFAVLSGTESLLANGFPPQDVEKYADEIRADLFASYGPTKAYANHRQKVVKKARRAARHVRGDE